MKKQLFMLRRPTLGWVFACLLLLASSVRGGATPTTLTYGDVVITGWNNQPVSGVQQVQFLLLKGVEAGTVIKFTLSHFNNTGTANSAGNGRVTAGVTLWTADVDYPAGTLIMLSKTSSIAASASAGSVSYITTGCSCGGNSQYMLQSTSGGSIFIYQKGTTESTSNDYSNSTTTATFNGNPIYIHGFQGTQSGYTTWLSSGTAGNFTSYLPSDLTSYSIFHSSNAIGGHYTGTGSMRVGSVAALRAAIMNTSNWTTTSGSGTVTIPTTTFTVTGSPSVTLTTTTNVTCNGGTNGSAVVTASGGTTPYTYSWSPSGGASSTATGLSAGTYTCTVTDAASATATVTATITEPATLAITGTNTLCATTTLSANLSGGTWSSSNTAVATVGTSGVVSGVAAGTAIITYAHTCGSPTRGVTVNLANPGTITGNTTLCATTFIAHGTTGTTGGTWVSSNTAVGTINSATGTMGGVINSAPASTTTVSYTVTNSCGSVTATVNNTVYKLSDTGVVSGPSSVCAGSTVTFTSTSSTATSGVGNFNYSWTSSNTSVSSINSSSGVATGVTVGTARISFTATGCGNFRAFRTLNVLPASVASITGTNTVTVTGTTTLSCATAGGTWSSTNTAVGTVSTGGVVTGLSSGTTTISYLISNSCGTYAATMNVTVGSSFSASITAQTNLSCNGGSNGSLTVTPSGGTPGYTYMWSNGATGATNTGLVAGFYTCTVADAATNTTTVTATVTEPTAVGGSTIVTNVACNGGTTGSIDLTPSGGSPGYTYNWGGGVTTQDRTGLAAGSYSCVVTDASSCTGTVTATVTQPTVVGGSTIVTNVACNGGTTGSIDLTPSGGTPGYTYNWGGGVTTQDRTGLAAGSYSCVVTDANSCTGTVTATVTQPTVVGGSTVVTNVACNGGSTGAINLTPSGGTPGYTYNWGGGVTTQDRTGLAAGSYTCVVTDANSCTGTVTATVTQPSTAVGGSTIVTNVACNGGTTGSIDLTPSGGTPGYTYNWGGGVTTQDRTGLAAGSYSCVVTDANSCTGTVTATVTQPSSGPGGSTVVFNVACNGGSNGAINFTPSGGTGPYTFNWGGGVTSEDRTSLTAGSYSVVVTDANSCTGTVTATVTQPTVVGGSTVVTNVACNGGSNGAINLTPSGGTPGYTFNWGGGVTTEDRTGLAAGSYTCVVTDANSCTGTVTATVTQPSSVVGGSTVVTNVACNGGSTGSIDLTPSGGTPGYTYNWGGGVTTQDRTGLAAGSYTCVVTDANACTGTVTATVTQPSTAVGGSTIVTNVACNGGTTGSIDLTPSGGTPGYTYNWGGGVTTQDRTGLAAGSYSCVVTDANSCTGTVTATVTQPTAVGGSTIVTNVACNGGTTGSIDLTPSGGTPGYTYNWGGGVTTQDRTGLAAGSYSCVVTDANSCTGTVTATVTQPTTVGGSTVVTNVACNGGSNGAINLTPSGGTPGYTYNWGGGVTTQDRTGLAAGSYSCVVTDANSCTGTVTATVTQPSSAVGGSTVVTNVACFGGNTGAINLTPGGGVGPYTFVWNGGATTEDRTSLSTGSYTVVITDANACTATVTATVTQPSAALTGTVSVTNVSCNGGSNGAINLTPAGGTTPYSFDWGGGVTTEDRTGLAAGGYTVVVTDGNLCTSTVTATVTQPSSVTASVSSVTDVTCFGASTGAASVSASGGTGGYTYSWAPSGGTGATTTGRAAGVYTCTVTDANGCPAQAVATITQPSSGLTISSLTGGGSYCVGNTINLSVTGTGGTGGYTYSWSGPSFSSSIQSPTLSSVTTSVTGVYTATVTDANGCPATGTATITVNTNPGASTGLPFTCAGGSITLSNATGGGTWSSSNTAIATVGSLTGVVTGVDSGTVNITYTVGTGCFSVMSLDVNPPMAPITGTPYVCLNTTSDLDHVMPGGTWSVATPYYVTVDASTGVITGAHSGGTTVTYTVNSGCSVTAAVYTSNVILNIAGSLSVCVGSTSALSTPGYPGGTWSTPDSATAYINATTGALLGVSAGTVPVTITYGYCYTSAIATVNPVPASISGGSAVCAGSTLALSCSTGGGVWSSSNTAKATVDGSGLVTGVAPGTATIYYIIGTGCAATKVVSVGAMPAGITGTTTLCEGSTTVLACSTLGGTWSSSATGTADVVSGTATASVSYVTISGIAAGGATISYSMPTGCVQTVNVTVATPPTSIGGTLAIGVGGTSTLTGSGGGTWSSSNTTVATIGGTTGVVTGAAAGTSTITYRVTTTCFTTAVVTVTAPPAITGPASVCKTYTVTLTHSTPGGTWSSSNTSVATIDATTGVVTGVSAGLINITYTMSPGYFSVRSLYVYNNPPAIVGASTMCTGATTAMASTIAGAAIWSSSNTSVATIGTATGVVSGLTDGVTDITYTTTATGCFTAKSLTVNETPSAISGATAMCVNDVETYVSTPSGGTWSSTAPSIGSIDATTGIATGRAAGGASIKYTMASGCFVSLPITVNALPGIISGNAPVCIGNTIVLTAGSTGSTWSSSASGTASVTATTSTTATISGITTGSANISYSNAAGCFRYVVVTVNDAVAPIVGDNIICIGGSMTLTSATSGGTWVSNSNPKVSVGLTSGLATGGTTTGTAVITYRVSAGCFVTKSITNNAALPNVVGATSTCSGPAGAVTFAIGVSGGTWSSSNTSVATVGSSSGLVTGLLIGGSNTNVTITYATSAGCTKSKVITIKPLPLITGADDVTIGTTATFTASPAGGAWTSSAATVAAVSTGGIVTGVTAGIATISYSASGCLSTKDVRVVTASSRPAGMTEEAVVLFSVFPNPAHGSLSVSTGVAGTFVIYSVDGKVASTNELTEGVNAISMPSGMAAGTYLCRFQGVDGSVQAVRLVYQP